MTQDPNAAVEIEAMLKSEPDLAHAASLNPRPAMESAYLRWCASKGVAPDLESVNPDASLSAARAGGISPTNPASSTARRLSADVVRKGKFSPAEARSYLQSFKEGTQEWYDACESVGKAQTEGRVKKK